jgi:hypothetical protein
MPKSFLWMLLLLCSSIAFSQNSFSIKGRVIDKNTKIPLESVTVYLTSKIDSTVVDYTITNKMGYFDLKLKKTNKSLVLKVSYVSYQDFKEDVSNLSADKDFGTIELEESIKSLDEVVVKSEAPPIRIKKDTLEFNASSFKVGADANVEALLKQLPGVEITPEGKITVNGKEVNNILVNGKPFFGKDGKVATQNLPAEIIDKVQVVDTKTKSEELSGEGASSEDKTINLTIQEDKNKGFFGKVMAGRGSDKRYESSLLLNYFKGEQKISVLASSNNINSVGFSMNEIFDNMGGGRNSSMYYNDNGTFGINGMQFGGGKGITQSNLVGINYQDKLFKKIDNSSSYYFSNADNENNNRTERTNLLPTGTTYTNSNSSSRSVSNGHNLNTDFEIKIDSTATIYINPTFTKNKSSSRFKRNQITTNETLDELNRSDSDDYNEVDNSNFETEASFYKQFKKKSRGMSVNVNFGIKDQKTFNNTNSATLFADTTPDDVRKQNSFEQQKQNNFKLEVRYGEPITDSLRLSVTSEIKFENKKETLNTFDFDAVANDYLDFNDVQSNAIRSKQFTYFPSTGFIIGKNKTSGRINFGPEFVNYRTESNYLAATTNVNKNYVFPKIKGYISHRMGKSKSIYANYNYEVTVPNANQLLPVENLSNPLNTIVGNENLDPTRRHSMYFGYNDYDYASRSGYYIYSGFNSSKDAIVSSTVFDDNFKSTTTYENVDKQFSSYFGTNWNKSFKKEKRKLSLSAGINFNYNINQGLTNAVLFESKEFEVNPRVNLTWSIDELITIAPSYKYSFSKTNFDNYVIDKADNFTHNAKIEITSYFPKKLVIGNDFGYTYNSNIAGGFKKDFYLWNTSIGYNFFKDQLLAKVKVYDLLNQNLNTRRTITPTAIIDTENTVLKRYVMFSLTYKLEKFGGKKKNDNMMFFED